MLSCIADGFVLVLVRFEPPRFEEYYHLSLRSYVVPINVKVLFPSAHRVVVGRRHCIYKHARYPLVDRKRDPGGLKFVRLDSIFRPSDCAWHLDGESDRVQYCFVSIGVVQSRNIAYEELCKQLCSVRLWRAKITTPL